MIRQRFVLDKQTRWRRLEEILLQLEKRGAKQTDEALLDEFVALYRAACSDLAKARTESVGDDVEEYLNVVVARAHKQFHPPTPPKLSALLGFLAVGFPVSVRRISRHVLAAALLFVLPLAAAAVAVVDNPKVAYSLSPPAQLEMLTEAYAKGHKKGRSESEDSLMTGYYINNNIGIAFKCFATGAFFGLGSIFFLVINGIIGGAIGAYIASAGHSVSFFSFVVGHGAFELTAIILSGATGLRLGALLINPGRVRRLDALKAEAPEMAKVILGSAVMLFVAALIEGFWSPSGAPPTVKFWVGALFWAVVILYLAFAGRRQASSLKGGVG
jgi:uncharacterized membrane protein SpoIIM required for sporulation